MDWWRLEQGHLPPPPAMVFNAPVTSTTPAARTVAGMMDQMQMDPYTALGVRPVINANGHETSLGGSLMPAEVLAAMQAAARRYVPLRALQRAAGRRVADVIGAPAALITTGASGAIL